MKQRFKTRDSALAYYINQLENLDKRLYMPLFSVTWARDMKLRSGITMANESTSYIRSTFAGTGSVSGSGGINGGNIPWASAEGNAIPGVSVNGQKITTPLRPVARELSYTSIELNRSSLTGQSIDAQKMDALNSLYQMNTDQMVYIGSTDVGATGLLNSSAVTAANVAAGAAGTTTWSTKTPDEILADVNTLLNSTWEASGLTLPPKKLILPAANFSLIASQKVSSAGNISVLKFLKENSISTEENGTPLEIVAVKWAKSRGAADTNRMCAYTNEEEFVRFPMVPIQRETAYYQGIRFIAPYIAAYGEVEIPYPETIQYADGI